MIAHDLAAWSGGGIYWAATKLHSQSCLKCRRELSLCRLIESLAGAVLNCVEFYRAGCYIQGLQSWDLPATEFSRRFVFEMWLGDKGRGGCIVE